MKKGTETNPSLLAGEPAAEAQQLLARLHPLRDIPAEDLIPALRKPLWRMRAIESHRMHKHPYWILGKGQEYFAPDVETAHGEIAWANALPVGWEPDLEAVRREAEIALPQLVGGRSDRELDVLEPYLAAQIRNVLAIKEGGTPWK